MFCNLTVRLLPAFVRKFGADLKLKGLPIAKRGKAMAMCASVRVSDATFFTELENANDIQRHQEITPESVVLDDKLQCPAFFTIYPDAPEKETATSKICSINDSDCFTVHEIWKAYSMLDATRKNTLHYEVKFDNRTLDFAGTAYAHPPSVYNALFAVELKGSKATIREGKHLGQALAYLRIMLKHQPWRHFCYGCISNQQTMILLKANRSEGENVKYDVFQEVNMDRAQPIIAFLLQSNEETLGAKKLEIDDRPIALQGFLGKGSTCSVYSGTWNLKNGPRQVAVKLYHRSNAKAELATLAKIRKIAGMPLQHLPDVLGVSTDNMICVVKLYHKLSISEMTPSCVSDIISVMELVHSNNIVHCDLRMENLLLDTGGRVVINDWGSSVASGAIPPTTPPEGQRHPGWRAAKPVHDIYSFALSVSLEMLEKKPVLGTVMDLAVNAKSWKECSDQLKKNFGTTTPL